MAAVLKEGQVVCTYQKQLLPFYDVFDELRYYQPGDSLAVFEVEGVRVGVTICEDLWNDKTSDDYNYENNPAERYRRAGVGVLLSLNSSPYVHDKCWHRINMIARSNEPSVTVVYVNQRGGQDELVFDGQSFVMRGDDLLYLSQELFEDSFDVVDLASGAQPIVRSVRAHAQSVRERSVALFDLLQLCLRDYCTKSGFSEVVLASSGGVDSAVVCQLAVAALGARHVHAIRMPSRFSSDHSRDDAIALHHNLGCWDYEVPVRHDAVVEMLRDHYEVHDGPDNVVARSGGASEVANENIQARLRDVYVMHFSNAYGAMPLSTGNKTESACGYYTHFDMSFSFAPIKDLLKFQVIDIARSHSAIPVSIWEKPPSAELRHGQTDEESLLPYAVLDAIVKAYVEDYVSTLDGMRQWFGERQAAGDKVSGDVRVLGRWLDSSTAFEDHDRLIRLIGKMEYKRRQTCPGTKVSRVAFGIGRRIPIVEKWS